MIELKDHERLDDLVIDDMKVIQRDDQFCFSLDTVLLAHFGEIPRGAVLDLGTGTGAIPLILTARGARNITGVEFNPIMADIARRNVEMNQRSEWIRVVEGDYRQLNQWAASGQFSAVYANPPYREQGRGAVSAFTGIRRARHEETASLEDVLAAVKYSLKYHGRFRMIHICERLADVLVAMRAYAIEPKCLRMIHGRPHKPAKLFLVEGIRGGKTGLTVLDPIIVHCEDGSYTRMILDWYGKV